MPIAHAVASSGSSYESQCHCGEYFEAWQDGFLRDLSSPAPSQGYPPAGHQVTKFC